MSYKKLAVLLLCIPLENAISAERISIEVSVVHFCPFICIDKTVSGFTVEIVDEIFKWHNIDVAFQEMPWARGVKESLKGGIAGMLAPSKGEAEGLVFPSLPIGMQKNCFFKKSTNPWQYKSADDLANVQTIVFTNWSHESDLMSFMAKKGKVYDQHFTSINYSGDYYPRAINMIMKDRANAFWADPSTLSNYLDKTPATQALNLVNAGCISASFVYLGISPKTELPMEAMYVEGITRLRESGRLDEILKKYKVTDWSTESEIHFQ